MGFNALGMSIPHLATTESKALKIITNLYEGGVLYNAANGLNVWDISGINKFLFIKLQNMNVFKGIFKS